MEGPGLGILYDTETLIAPRVTATVRAMSVLRHSYPVVFVNKQEGPRDIFLSMNMAAVWGLCKYETPHVILLLSKILITVTFCSEYGQRLVRDWLSHWWLTTIMKYDIPAKWCHFNKQVVFNNSDLWMILKHGSYRPDYKHLLIERVIANFFLMKFTCNKQITLPQVSVE